MSIPSIDQISGAFNAIYQGLAYTAGFIPPMYNSISRMFQINKIYNDPNMGTIKKTASVLLTTMNMTAESQLVAHKINLSPNEDLQRLARLAVITRQGMDALYLLGNENPNIWERCLSGAKFGIKIERIVDNREDLNTAINVINFAETAEILYTHRETILPVLKKLYKRTLQASQTAKNALQIQSATSSQQTNIQTGIAQIDPQEATNSQALYQDLLSRYRKTFQGRHNNLEILDLLNQEIHKELKPIKSKLRECEAIIEGEDITHFDTIPFLLHGEAVFQKRMCRISGKPIRKVVVVQASSNSKPIYYEWKNLQQALENDVRPSRWPVSLAFGPESTMVNIEETREVVNELKKASANPEFKKEVQKKYLEYKIQKEEFEGVCKLIESAQDRNSLLS